MLYALIATLPVHFIRILVLTIWCFFNLLFPLLLPSFRYRTVIANANIMGTSLMCVTPFIKFWLDKKGFD